MTDLSLVPFQGWPKIPRLRRDMVVTEKIDGTNAAIGVIQFPFGRFTAGKTDEVPGTAILAIPTELGADGMPEHEYLVYAQSRRRVITPDDDNFGFARWVYGNADSLCRVLGAGLHYGEWWGHGIQRGYGLDHKRFSLFNVSRWAWLGDPEIRLASGVMPELRVVPVIRQHTFSTRVVDEALSDLRDSGSYAAPGFKDAEGVVVYHTAAGTMFKATLDNDAQAKAEVLAA